MLYTAKNLKPSRTPRHTKHLRTTTTNQTRLTATRSDKQIVTNTTQSKRNNRQNRQQENEQQENNWNMPDLRHALFCAAAGALFVLEDYANMEAITSNEKEEVDYMDDGEAWKVLVEVRGLVAEGKYIEGIAKVEEIKDVASDKVYFELMTQLACCYIGLNEYRKAHNALTRMYLRKGMYERTAASYASQVLFVIQEELDRVHDAKLREENCMNMLEGKEPEHDVIKNPQRTPIERFAFPADHRESDRRKNQEK